MALIDLYVLDKETGHIHRVGDDCHDSLDVRDGEVHYHNLQNGDGTLPGNMGGYVFVDSEAGMCDSSKQNERQKTDDFDGI